MLLNDRQSQFYNYTSRLRKHRHDFFYASKTAREELRSSFFGENFERDLKSKGVKYFLISKKLMHSSFWVSRSSFKLLKSHFDFKKYENANQKDALAQKILTAVRENKKLPSTLQISDQKIFKTIYNELEFNHINHCDLDTFKLKIPSNVTIVLISGVFNEIFSTPAFQRGADYLKEKYTADNFSINVSGIKDSKKNSAQILIEIKKYLDANPGKKLWIVSFSKGGLDTLHFLKTSPDLKEHIFGVSLIACPILGSEYVNHKLIKTINASTVFLQKVSKGKKIFQEALEFKKSLDATYRTNWFKSNHKKLPELKFYTAVALESHWYDSHVWMMLTKAIFFSNKSNDGIVETDRAQFPAFFNGINLGVLDGHHLIGTRSSFYNQEALLEAHLVFLKYKNLI